MLDRLIDYYEKNLTAKVLVFRYMRVWSAFFWLSLIVASACFIPAALSGNILYILIGFAVFIATAYGFNNKAKQVIRKRYKIKVTSKIWSGLEYHSYIENELKLYLIKTEIIREKLIAKIIEQLSKRVEDKKKVTYYFLPGVFFAFSVPAWTQYLGKLFTHVEENNGNTLNLMIQLIIGISIVTFILAFIKYTTDDLLSLKGQKLSMLLDYLESIQLEAMHLEAEKKDNNEPTYEKAII